MVGHGGNSAGSYLADPTSPIPSHCASIVMTSTLREFCSIVLQQQNHPKVSTCDDPRAVPYLWLEASAELSTTRALVDSQRLHDKALSARVPAQEMTSNDGRLVVMFTTFSDNPKKIMLFRNAIRNWATFMPLIQPVLFFTNATSNLNILAKQHGWKVLPAPRVNKYGVPFLKDMYREAYRIDKAQFYAFVNGDILFDNGLTTTLHGIQKNLPRFNATIITGKRKNYDVNCTTQNLDVWKPHHVMELGQSKKAKYDGPWCEDYFFVTPDFPWDSIKDVVIARELYDNYLILTSREMNLTTIDITDTITALHQCAFIFRDRNATKKDIDDIDFNRQLIGKIHNPAGFSTETILRTEHGSTGELAFGIRRKCPRVHYHRPWFRIICTTMILIILFLVKFKDLTRRIYYFGYRFFQR